MSARDRSGRPDPTSAGTASPGPRPQSAARIAYGGFLDLIGRNVAPAIFLALVILASLFVKNFADMDNAR